MENMLVQSSFLRSAILCASLVIVAAAQASYELLAIPAADNTLRRIDPLSGTSLGSINLPAGTRSVELDGATGNGYALAGEWLHRFDYSTGERRGAWRLGPGFVDIALSEDGTRLHAMTPTNLTTLSTTTFSVLSATAIGSFVTITGSVTRFGPNRLAMSEDYNTGSSLFSLTKVVDSTSGAITGTYSSANGVANPGVNGKVASVLLPTGQRRVVVASRGPSHTIVNTTVFSAAGTNGISSNFLNSNFSLSGGRAVSAVASHGGFYLIGPGLSGGTRIEEYEGSSLALISARNYAFDLPTGFFGPAAVIAPEPGTMLAFGAGLAGLIARRRRARR